MRSKQRSEHCIWYDLVCMLGRAYRPNHIKFSENFRADKCWTHKILFIRLCLLILLLACQHSTLQRVTGSEDTFLPYVQSTVWTALLILIQRIQKTDFQDSVSTIYSKSICSLDSYLKFVQEEPFIWHRRTQSHWQGMWTSVEWIQMKGIWAKREIESWEWR